MNDSSFEEQVSHHLALFAAPDYTAKGDAVNFFKIHAQQALPILKKLAAGGDDSAKQMHKIAKKYSASGTDDKEKKGTYMASRPDLF